MSHPSIRCLRQAVWLILGLSLPGSLHADQPSLSPPTWNGDPSQAQLTLTNCTNTSVQYLVQMSTDLTNWTAISTNAAAPTNVPISIPTTNQLSFYRLVTIHIPIPVFQYAIVTISNLNFNGNNSTVDSFDSSNPLYSIGGMYVVAKRKANGNIGTDSSLVNSINLGNVNVYGHVTTGPGTVQTNVQIGSNGVVGDIAWNAGQTGIEPGYWTNNFNVSIPDVSPPATGSALPATVNGVKTFNGGNFTAGRDPGVPLVITTPTTLWIQGSCSPIITITNAGSLVLYVGKPAGSGDSLSISNISGNVNFPGYANNLQIYGLRSLTSVSIWGIEKFAGCVYAPEADVVGGGGGHNYLDASGAFIAKSITLNGRWNFHYDESLAVNGPVR